MTQLVSNKKVGMTYEIGEKMFAGVELFGYEVKALRKNQGSLEGSYIIVRGGEAFLIGAYIPPYQAGNTPKEYNDRRNRVLLLHKKEIAMLADIENKKTPLIPLAFIIAGTKIKLEFTIAKGKKKYDKRQSIKRRDLERETGRKFKEGQELFSSSLYTYLFSPGTHNFLLKICSPSSIPRAPPKISMCIGWENSS
jgi:SsrA-binding protein